MSESEGNVEHIGDHSNDDQGDASNEEQGPTRVEMLLKNDQTDLKKHINGMVASVNVKNAARKAINQEVSAIYTTSEAKGLNKKGVKAALKYLDLSDADRDAFLLTFRLILEAQGSPIQKDLFLDTEEFNQDQEATG